MSPNNAKKVQIFSMLLAGAIAVGSLAFAVGQATAPSNGDMELRLEKCENLLERWDERWTFIRDKLRSIEAKLDAKSE